MTIPKTVTNLSIQLSKTHQGYIMEIHFHNNVCVFVLHAGVSIYPGYW